MGRKLKLRLFTRRKIGYGRRAQFKSPTPTLLLPPSPLPGLHYCLLLFALSSGAFPPPPPPPPPSPYIHHIHNNNHTHKALPSFVAGSVAACLPSLRDLLSWRWLNREAQLRQQANKWMVKLAPVFWRLTLISASLCSNAFVWGKSLSDYLCVNFNIFGESLLMLNAWSAYWPLPQCLSAGVIFVTVELLKMGWGFLSGQLTQDRVGSSGLKV